MSDIDTKLVKKIDELIQQEYLKTEYNDGEGYTTYDLNDIIEGLLYNHTFTSKDSIQDLSFRLDKMMGDFE